MTLEELLKIHERTAGRIGGQAGAWDYGLLLSVLRRPQTGHYEGLAQMGAALIESRIVNHPFVDANKRVAFFGVDVFFRLNGFQFEVNANEADSFLIELIASDKCDYNSLLPWIEKSIAKSTGM